MSKKHPAADCTCHLVDRETGYVECAAHARIYRDCSTLTFSRRKPLRDPRGRFATLISLLTLSLAKKEA